VSIVYVKIILCKEFHLRQYLKQYINTLYVKHCHYLSLVSKREKVGFIDKDVIL